MSESRRISTGISLDLDRLWALDPAFILPNHGDPEVIAGGGYSSTLIRATQDYIRALQQAAA